MIKRIKNLFVKTESVLQESLVNDAAEMAGVEEEHAKDVIKGLNFANYLELGNAIDIEDVETVKEILNVATAPSGEEFELEEDEYEHPEDQFSHDPTILCSLCGSQGYDDWGNTCTKCGGQGRLTLDGEYITGDEDITEADNPSAPVTPPSAGSSIDALAEPTATAADNDEVQRIDVEDLSVGDEIEVAGIDGEPVSAKIMTLNSPGETIVVRGKKNTDHMIKKNSILSTPIQEGEEIFVGDYEINTDAMREAYETALNEVSPPGMEGWIKKRKPEFKKRYGSKWEEVLYATAWKQHNNESIKESRQKPYVSKDTSGWHVINSTRNTVKTFSDAEVAQRYLHDHWRELVGEDRVDHREIIDMISPHVTADDMAEDLLQLIDYAFDDLEIGFDADLANKVLIDMGREPIAENINEGLHFWVEPLANGIYEVRNDRGDIHDVYDSGKEARKVAADLNAQYGKIDEEFKNTIVDNPGDRVMTSMGAGTVVEIGPDTEAGQRVFVKLDVGDFDGDTFWFDIFDLSRLVEGLERLRELAGINEVKSGNFNSKMIGKRVKIMAVDSFGNDHIGEEGVIHRASREHTFSQMVPFVIEYGVTLDSGERITIRRERVRKVKQITEDPADKHQKRIAIDTVKNPNKALLGGPSAKEAENTLRNKFGYTDKQIAKLKETATGGATSAGAIASSPSALGGMQSRNSSIYGQTKLRKKPEPKKRPTTEEKSEGIGRNKKD